MTIDQTTARGIEWQKKLKFQWKTFFEKENNAHTICKEIRADIFYLSRIVLPLQSVFVVLRN